MSATAAIIKTGQGCCCCCWSIPITRDREPSLLRNATDALVVVLLPR